jgi:hypothetical protein
MKERNTAMESFNGKTRFWYESVQDGFERKEDSGQS